MAKKDLYREISEKSGLPIKTVSEVLSFSGEAFINEAVRSGKCQIVGVGTLSVVSTAARSGKIGGKEWSKPAGKKIKFSPSKSLKEAL